MAAALAVGADIGRLNVRPVPAAAIRARIAIGAVVSRRDVLRPLPIRIVEIVPGDTGDVSVETEADIAIVDSDTLEIADVIPF